MSIMDQPVADSIGDGGVGDDGVPVLGFKLTGDDGGGISIPVLEDFEEVFALRRGQDFKAEIIEDEDVGFGKAAQEGEVSAISPSLSEFVE